LRVQARNHQDPTLPLWRPFLIATARPSVSVFRSRATSIMLLARQRLANAAIAALRVGS
jgi:hypothetical protein